MLSITDSVLLAGLVVLGILALLAAGRLAGHPALLLRLVLSLRRRERGRRAPCGRAWR